jgi:predicted nucleotidyltransferase
MPAEALHRALATYFATRADVVSAYLFGSQATGHTHAQSDVDVGVLLDRTALPTSRDRAHAAILLNAGIIAATHVNDVDVVVLNDVTPELGASIVTAGQRVYCTDELADREATRRMVFRHADLRPFLERTRRLKLATFAAGNDVPR